ncbi:unnamed protein product [Hermetia illucens]|uniref:Serpin domain-containing protein n=1 Tax=Hermetia illucens TaxID=343691 RepID=A0A7R8YUI2_HERIL|nr:serine protease inhibitor 27A [Hermetia illucens]CAD7082784.1 unnamed protein product [Hermetia illucens]
MFSLAFLFFIGVGQFTSASLQQTLTATTQSSSRVRAGANSTLINDTDYWDYDDFVPFREDRHDTFDWKLLKEVLLADSSNIIVSPFSVKILLALLSEGAGAESITKKELSAVLPNIRTPTLARELYRRILTSLNEPNKNYELHVGTKIFTDEFVEPRQRFASIAEAHYGTTIDRLDFKNARGASEHINRWCSNLTRGHIPELISKDDLDSAVMVMTNAIFFDGVWRKPFAEETSFEFTFYRTPHEEIRTTYMTQQGNFYFFESKKMNAKIIRLPYKGKKFSMTIILPGAKGGLDELVREIEGDGLKRLQWLMEEVQVKVTIPRFHFDRTTHMKEVLEKLGIQEVFTLNASLPGLARGAGLNNQLKVSDIIQKCGLIVNEKGTVAYGATDVVITNKFGDTTVHEFMANRPFMFIIEDETTGTIIFAGKVTDPNKN